ncbi:expressed unknown protein [Ectocarpus siliculosus]|uniref:Uncharacterized protein n=1 Tax=Ectocarpus siliculosus TaxID=2880 RepID=D7FZA0_ECTSI|nr:expressed unknown protein [Ectocarpus siliculosus]|eukprot:CBJ32717.1 expressed unknown protein [Ectocarpus siliculosus]
MVVVDTRKDETVLSQKLAREIFSRVQKLRKKSSVQVGETVKGAVAGAAMAAYTALVTDAVRCIHRCRPRGCWSTPFRWGTIDSPSAGGTTARWDEADTDQKPDFTVFLTRSCLSVDRMRFFLFLRFLLALMCLRLMLNPSCFCVCAGGIRLLVLLSLLVLVLWRVCSAGTPPELCCLRFSFHLHANRVSRIHVQR